MEPINYLDLDLHIEKVGSEYRARIINSPAGQADTTFTLPFSELELENFILRIGRSRKGVRRLETPETEAARKFGARLFESVFSGEMRGHVRSSMLDARQRGAGLRFKLRLTDAPELAELPWEYLYDSSLDEFLVLSVQSPIVRYLDLPLSTVPLTINLPLKVLVMISTPSNYLALDVEKEYENLEKSLGDLIQRGLVQLTRLEKASLVHLQRQLRRDQYHIFHFVGHGGYDQYAQDGVLVLEDKDGLGHPVSGRYLGTLLHDHRSLRLAVLNACEGARTSRNDPFSGVAHSLVQKGIPAVIAMQFEISDDAAIIMAREFYGAIADGYPVDASLAEARKAVFASSNDIEWGTPVLYMRSPDGRIFGVERKESPFPEHAPPAVDLTFQPRQGDASHPAIQPASPVQPSLSELEAHRSHSHDQALPGGHASWAHEHPVTDAHAERPPHKKRNFFAWFGASIGLFALAAALLIAFGVIDPAALIPIDGRSAGSVANVALLTTETSTPSPTPTLAPTSTPTLAPTEPEVTPLPVVLPVATETVAPTPEPTPTETPTQGPTPVGSGNGQIAFASDRSGSAQIWLVDIDGNNLTQLTNRPDGACQPAWSPDGSQLVFISPCRGNQPQYENSALYLINADGSGEQKITEGIGGGDYDPAWSPDGTRIAFASDRENFTSIYILDVASLGEPIALTRNSPNQQPEWSPDGSQIVFVTFRLGSWQVYTMPQQGEIAADGHQARQFSRQNEFYYSNPRWSPDGTILVFTKQLPETGSQPDLFGSKIADKGLVEFAISTASGKGPMKEADFSPDGKWLAYEGWPSGSNHDIWIMTANGNDRRPVTQDNALDFDAAWRP